MKTLRDLLSWWKGASWISTLQHIQKIYVKQNNFAGWLESCMNITTQTALFGFIDDTHKMLWLFNHVAIICKLHMCKSRKHFTKIMGL